MAGRIQLETTSLQDKYLTDDPEFTYFIKNFKKHDNYSKFYKDLDLNGNIEFGELVKCTIPQDQGDLLKGVSLKMTLEPSPPPSPENSIYCESIGQAIIEYADIIIGGTLIHRVPSDMIMIHSELNVTQSQHKSLRRLVGKPELSYSYYNDYYKLVRSALTAESLTKTKYRVDIPFYFHDHPELAIPMYAITKQEIEIHIKLRSAKECIFTNVNTSLDIAETYYLGVEPKGLISDMKVCLELVTLDKKPKMDKPIDYIITQTQQNTFELDVANEYVNSTLKCNEHVAHLSFKNNVKEMFFVVKDKFNNNPSVANDFSTPFQYSASALFDTYGFFTNSEQVKYISLNFDGEQVLNEITGDMVHLRAIQPGKHHSRTPIYRRFYSYSFALEPERWYPTGQLNFSVIKNQVLKIGLFDYPLTADKQLRVYAQSYNILRLENGTVKLLFNT